MTALAHPLSIIMHSKTHWICLAAGLRADPLGGELTALARPQLLRTENGFLKNVEQKRVMRLRDKHRDPPEFDYIVAPALDVWCSTTAYMYIHWCSPQYGILLPPPPTSCRGCRSWVHKPSACHALRRLPTIIVSFCDLCYWKRSGERTNDLNGHSNYVSCITSCIRPTALRWAHHAAVQCSTAW